MPNQVQTYRTEREMTIAELAQKVGVSPSTISRVENEVFTPKYDLMKRLAKELGAQVEDLFPEGKEE
jgi:DNA-binding XRE family transcriptional regulator